MVYFRSVEDLIMPFTAIGEPGWEDGVRRILEAVADSWGEAMPLPVGEETLEATEKRLGTALPPSLRLFLTRFGVADVGEELQDPGNMVPLSDWAEGMDLEEFITEEERASLDDLFTFSEHVGRGCVFCFHRDDNSVYFFDPETAPHLGKLFNTVDDYLKACLLNVQDIFFDPSVRDPENLIEEELVRLFGERAVAKWLY